MYDAAKIEALVDAVKTCSAGPNVIEVTYEFAGYFDELGITVQLDPKTPKREVFDMKDRIAQAILSSKYPFAWTIRFEQPGKADRILFPDGLFT